MKVDDTISPNELLQRLRDLSSRVEGGVAAAGSEPGAPDFSQMLKQSLDQVNAAQRQAASLGQAYEFGDPSVSISELTLAMQRSSLAFQAATQVRNKLVSAYKEIMSMQV